MSFPADPLDVEVSLALGADLTDPGSWSWTDITAYVRENNRIRIRRGRSSERSTIPPSRCTLTVDNTDGRFCRLNPLGAWYGQIGKNTPLRVRVNNGGGYVTRFIGYVSGWPPSWDPSERDQTVTLVADGILRRLGQGRVLRSALERAILADGPSQFWPMTDESGSTRAASGVTGGATMSATAAEFGSATGPDGAAGPLVGLSDGRMDASFPAVGTTAYTLEMIIQPTAVPTATDQLWRLVFPNGGITEDAEELPEDTEWHHYLWFEEQVGADVHREIWIDGQLHFSNTVLTSTISLPIGLALNYLYPSFTSPMNVGMVALHPHANVDAAARYQAMLGWVGEQAHDRVDRLCAEEGVPVTVTATSSQAMGAQRVNTLVALLRECASTDSGLLYEPADDTGLAYLSSTERYSLAAAITLEYDQGHVAPPWDPTDDDLGARNDVTASRPGGSSARVTDETSIAAIGVYDDTLSANTEGDDQLIDVAGWAVNLGTVDELRWPAVRPNLLKHPALIDDWLTVDLGSKLTVTGHPSPLAPQDIEQVIEGYDETFGSYEYSVTANLSPASGWDVGVYGVDPGGVVSRYGASNTFMAAAATSSATRLLFDPRTDPWALTSTHGSAFPFDIDLGGLTYATSAITGALMDDFTRSASNGFGTATSGQVWSTPTGGSASNYSVSGTRGRIAPAVRDTEHRIWVDMGTSTSVGTMNTTVDVTAELRPGVVTTGAEIQMALDARLTDASNYARCEVSFETSTICRMRLRRQVAGVNSIFSYYTLPFTYGASTGVMVRLRVYGDDMWAKAWVSGTSEPNYWHIYQFEGAVGCNGTKVGFTTWINASNTNALPLTTEYDLLSTAAPLAATVTRLATDKAHSVGDQMTTDIDSYGL